jgi:hypothetical protein
MEVWQVILYGFAAVLALRSLTGLMVRHRMTLDRDQAQRDEAQRLEEEQAQAEAASAVKSPAPRRNGHAA